MGDTPPIRLARADDLPALTGLAIRSMAVWGYDAAFTAACRDELTPTLADLQTGAVALIDGPEGAPIARAHVTCQGDRAELHKPFVDPGDTGRSLGHRVVK